MVGKSLPSPTPLQIPASQIPQLLTHLLITRRMHPSRLRPHWRSRRLRRLVLSLPWLALRYFWAGEEGACAAEFGGAGVWVPGG